MVPLPFALLLGSAPAFVPAGGAQLSCLENIRGKAGRARIEVVVGAGSLHEAEGEHGVAHLLEHLLLRPLGFDDSNGATGWDFTSFNRETRAGELDDAAEALLLAVRDPSFDETSFRLERQVVLRELVDRGIDDHTEDPLFGRTPLGRSPGGTERSVGRLELEDARRFFARHYRQGNVAVVIRGAVDCPALIERLTPILAGFPEGEAAPVPPLGATRPRGPRLPPGGTFVGGFFWLEATPADEVIARLALKHLEQSAFEELRKERGLVYSPIAAFERRGPGGRISLQVAARDQEEVARWYEGAVERLRRAEAPREALVTALPVVRDALEAEAVRSALAAIRGEPQPVELLERLDDAELRAGLARVLAPEASFGSAAESGSVLRVVILVLFAALVLFAMAVAGRRILGM